MVDKSKLSLKFSSHPHEVVKNSLEIYSKEYIMDIENDLLFLSEK